MAKKTATGRYSGWVKRDSTGRFVDAKNGESACSGLGREILFPTEPTSISTKKIDRAIERVVARKK